MPNKKIATIIFEEVRSVPKRCKSYSETLLEAISDILDLERQHKVQGINIQQRINDKCSAAGRLLAESRGHSARDKE